MSSITIGDIEVSFPFNPYPAQVEYMRAVIEALNSSCNALMESPTGTGKTLCLLCATLAWLEKRRATLNSEGASDGTGIARVVYCSRTHAQLSQVIRELKRTRYGSIFSMAILGSREHMCLNPQVLRLSTAQSQQNMCNRLQEEMNCRFYRPFQSRGTRKANMQRETCVHDMEDLVSEGRKYGFCPYYSEREEAKEANIVFLPYNYVLDPSLRKQLPFDMKGCILIADEAHNLPGILGTSSCVNLGPLELTNAIHDSSRAVAMQRVLIEAASENEIQDVMMNEQELSSLKIILCNLERCIAEESHAIDEKHSKLWCETNGSFSGDEIVREGSYMIPFLGKALITRELFFGGSRQHGGINEVMTKSIEVLSQSENVATGMSKVQQFLTFVFESSDNGDEEASRFIIQGGKAAAGRISSRTLGYWCLDTTRAVEILTRDIRSLLLTSGTLSPLDHFAAELGIPFNVCLKGSHVIQRGQVVGCVLCKGPGGEKLNASYAFRNSVNYREGLGMSLVNISRNTPGGLLVFFPSYVALNMAVELWRSGSGRPGETVTVWGMLEKVKPVFVEPVETADLNKVVKSFQQEVDAAPMRGAILLAVCRGKVSEGVDFADNHGRCVVVAGIPFANHTDLFVRLKRDYITRLAPQRPKVRGRLFTGDEWYVNEAMRAVNQCVGRVIRHKDDYGAVVFADERFADRLGGLSEWVAENCAIHRDFRETYTCLSQFFLPFRRSAGGGGGAELKSGCSSFSTISPPKTNVPVVVYSEQVPDSAEMARRFATEQLRQLAADREMQRQKCITDAKELPTISLKATIAKEEDLLPAKMGETTIATTTSSLVTERPSFRKQMLHALPVSSATDASKPLVGPTSKEFCQFLKERLQPGSYNEFRDTLKMIASIRNAPGLSSDDKKRALTSAVDGVASVFKEAAGERETELFHAFGEHIPEEFRPYYTHLLRKRRRSS